MVALTGKSTRMCCALLQLDIHSSGPGSVNHPTYFDYSPGRRPVHLPPQEIMARRLSGRGDRLRWLAYACHSHFE